MACSIEAGQWTEKTGADLEEFPTQTSGDSCGIFMLMYALCLCTSTPYHFSENDMPQIRRWWCVHLLQRFAIEGYAC
ncbi:sentrin-specific protease 5-like [Clupea harengus]|uniref:Sentrin-specific protease 5-like n=1 Tax=Clupea harengus TaxID=7950 RepID=A0A8M1KPN7_CLUHA|nr:sentrin-specific protease 5-like [Clupea harengus]